MDRYPVDAAALTLSDCLPLCARVVSTTSEPPLWLAPQVGLGRPPAAYSSKLSQKRLFAHGFGAAAVLGSASPPSGALPSGWAAPSTGPPFSLESGREAPSILASLVASGDRP